MKVAIRFSFLFLLTLLNSVTLQAQLAEFSFDKKIIKLPAADAGEQLTMLFPFENTGTEPLIITKSEVECSCTRVTFPKEPILPGEKAVIEVKFDSNGKMGWQYRKIILLANIKKGREVIEFRVKIKN
ncbi:MAG: DUF1573 domain-containing protein [Flavobacteriales bacterium]